MLRATSQRKARSVAREKQRRWRARRKAGLVVVQFTTDEANLSALLVALGKLRVNCSDDRRAISIATRELVEGLVVGEGYPERYR